jgi:glycerol-3-phosphate dehydrogenase (NAD(P)+)
MSGNAEYEPRSAGVVGAGAWGTALAQTLKRAGLDVMIWARRPEIVAEINAGHSNETYLPGARLDSAIRATDDPAQVARADVVLMVVPTQHLRGILEQLAPRFDTGRTPLVLCCKGFEQGTQYAPHSIAQDVLGRAVRPFVLSGPSFAAEVVRGLPTAVTLACDDQDRGKALARAMSHRAFRIYVSDDVIGVALGGAIKNVLAIAAGIVAGRRLGQSAQAALITRGFHELSTFARAHGARPETLTGLSCLGDLILTCNSPLSRNFSLGRELGEGRALAEIMAGRRSVAEGVSTAQSVVSLAQRAQIDMPISAAVDAIVAGRLGIDAAIDALLARPLRSEA